MVIMSKSEKIRAIALGLIRDGDRIFIGKSYDPERKKTFYRAMGGGVKFGETSLEALKREFQEEIQAELTNIRYLGCLESIFVFKGKPDHEIIQLYEGDFVDPKFYQLQQIAFVEKKNRQKLGLWVEIDKLKSGELYVVPSQFLDYL